MLEVKEAIATAKSYVKDIYSDEQVSNLGLEEVEFDPSSEKWMITVGFSRPWNSSRTRAQEVIEQLNGTISGLRRSYKTLVLSPEGKVLSMKNREANE